MVEERFGPYVLHGLLGRGGMGEVYRAADTRKHGRLVALKRLPVGLSDDADFHRRFLREAELASRLNERHVLPIHDYGQIDGRPYLDMRLVEGVDVATLLDRFGALPPPRAVRIVGQVARALDAAHRNGLVHRDVKPRNVLVDGPAVPEPAADDFVYLIDFGIAANLLTSTRSSSVVSGTAAYMAPERFGSGGDHGVDVYALGCVLYELLTDRVPFAGDFVQLMGAHLHTSPPRPSALSPGLPAALDDVVTTAMAKDPSERFRSAGELAAAARDAVRVHTAASVATTMPGRSRPLPASKLPSTVPPSRRSRAAEPAETPPRPSPERARRRSVRLVLAALAVVVLVGVGLLGTRLWIGQQYFVALSGNEVVVFHGVRGSVLGVDLQTAYELTGVYVEELPVAARTALQSDQLPTGDLEAAHGTVERLRAQRLPRAAPTAPVAPPFPTAPAPLPLTTRSIPPF